MEVVLQIVKDLGFPVACCLYLGYYLKKLLEAYRADIREITDKYDRSIEKFSRSIDKNTSVLTALESKIDGKEE